VIALTFVRRISSTRAMRGSDGVSAAAARRTAFWMNEVNATPNVSEIRNRFTARPAARHPLSSRRDGSTAPSCHNGQHGKAFQRASPLAFAPQFINEETQRRITQRVPRSSRHKKPPSLRPGFDRRALRPQESRGVRASTRRSICRSSDRPQ